MVTNDLKVAYYNKVLCFVFFLEIPYMFMAGHLGYILVCLHAGTQAYQLTLI